MREWLSIPFSFRSLISTNNELLLLQVELNRPLSRKIDNAHRVLPKRSIPRNRGPGSLLRVHSRQIRWLPSNYFCHHAGRTHSSRLGDVKDILRWAERRMFRSLPARSWESQVSERPGEPLLSWGVSRYCDCPRFRVPDIGIVRGARSLCVSENSCNKWVLFVDGLEQRTHITKGEFHFVANISSRFNFKRDPGIPGPPFPRSICFTPDNTLVIAFSRQNIA